MSRPDLVVVGGGIAGAAVALAARALGASVLLLERAEPGGRATPAAAGMLAAQYEAEGPDAHFRFSVRAREVHGAFAARIESLAGRRIHRRRDGMLVVNRDREEHERALRAAAWQSGEGLRADVLEVDAARRLQPGLCDGARSYLWLPDEAWVDSRALSRALPDALAAAGVETRTGTEVVGVRSEGGRLAGLALADGATLPARRAVLAAGAWSGRLEGLPRELPVRPVRGQMVRYPPGDASPGRIVADHAGRYVVPRADGGSLAGSTMEEVGFDAATTEEGISSVRRGAEALLPALAGVEPVDRWAGLRPVSRDGRPVLGPDPALEGLHYATGYGRNGILLAPLVGRRVAEAALRPTSHGEADPFGPDRFGARPAVS